MNVDAEPLERGTAAEYASWFRALADATRVQIVSLLARRGVPMKVGEIVSGVAVGQSTVSAHLKVLSEVGFVLAERRGTATYYRIGGWPPILGAVEVVGVVVTAASGFDLEYAWRGQAAGAARRGRLLHECGPGGRGQGGGSVAVQPCWGWPRGPGSSGACMTPSSIRSTRSPGSSSVAAGR